MTYDGIGAAITAPIHDLLDAVSGNALPAIAAWV